MLEARLISLRKKIRLGCKTVIDRLINEHDANICVICGKIDQLTKEHVVPKWMFENDPNKNLVTDVNGIGQTYNKTTVPACLHCNSYILSALEDDLNKLFRMVDLKRIGFSNAEKERIILWLEIIDYKFQVLNLRRKLIKPKNGPYIPYLSNLPVSIIQKIDLSPSKVFSSLRNSLRRLSVKTKAIHINSLIVFKTSNKSFHFFHKVDDFIFFELPNHGCAFFYFFKIQFTTHEEAHKAAMKIIEKVY